MVEYHPISAKRPVATASVRPKSFGRHILWTCVARGENLERRHCGRRHWRMEEMGRIWTPRQKAQCKGSVDANERWTFHIPVTDGTVKLSGGDQVLRTSTLIRGQPWPWRRARKSSRIIRRVSTSRLTSGWRWSKKRFLVYLSRFHLPSSRGTPSQTVRAEREEWPGRWVPKACSQQAAADPRGSRTCMCANTFLGGWHTQGEKGEWTSCRGTVQSAWCSTSS